MIATYTIDPIDNLMYTENHSNMTPGKKIQHCQPHKLVSASRNEALTKLRIVIASDNCVFCFHTVSTWKLSPCDHALCQNCIKDMVFKKQQAPCLDISCLVCENLGLTSTVCGVRRHHSSSDEYFFPLHHEYIDSYSSMRGAIILKTSQLSKFIHQSTLTNAIAKYASVDLFRVYHLLSKDGSSWDFGFIEVYDAMLANTLATLLDIDISGHSITLQLSTHQTLYEAIFPEKSQSPSCPLSEGFLKTILKECTAGRSVAFETWIAILDRLQWDKYTVNFQSQLIKYTYKIVFQSITTPIPTELRHYLLCSVINCVFFTSEDLRRIRQKCENRLILFNKTLFSVSTTEYNSYCTVNATDQADACHRGNLCVSMPEPDHESLICIIEQILQSQ